MRSLLVVVDQILRQDVSQMRFTEDNEVSETLVLDASSEAFGHGILIGCARRPA
jgi:hypothetical protein